MNLRAAATSVFVFILLAMASGLISANVRKLVDKHGWDNFLVRWTEELRWERLRRLWWLWSIFGLSGGVALALWLTPLITVGAPTENGARQVELSHMQQQVSGLQSQLDTAQRQRDDTQQKLTAAEKARTSAEERAHTAETRASSLETQIATLQSKVASPSAPHWSKNEILRLQQEVFAIHEVLNAADQKLRDPLTTLANNGIQIVAQNGRDKSVEMINSYVDTVQNLYEVIVQQNPVKFRYDWGDLEPLTGADPRHSLSLFITILTQYRSVLVKPGEALCLCFR
jgi:hypothetical protein